MLSVTYLQLFVISGAVFLSNSLIQDTPATTWPIDVSGIPQWSKYEGCSVQCNSGATQCLLLCLSGPSRLQKDQQYQADCDPGQRAERSACCLTCQSYEFVWAFKPKGRKVYVLHEVWKGEVQLLPIGVCSNKKAYSCSGRCAPHFRAHPVKVADRPVLSSNDLAAATTWYEYVSLPSYCMCPSGGISYQEETSDTPSNRSDPSDQMNT